jgi:hypothetical protein
MTSRSLAPARLHSQRITGAAFRKPGDVVRFMGAVQAQGEDDVHPEPNDHRKEDEPKDAADAGAVVKIEALFHQELFVAAREHDQGRSPSIRL